MNKKTIIEMPIEKLLLEYPFMSSYFEDHADRFINHDRSVGETYAAMSQEEMEEYAIDEDASLDAFYTYFEQMCQFLGIHDDDRVRSLTILPGWDKSKTPENYDRLHINTGEIIAIVGPTGSGKSRLLADIEWTANADTPTGRRILINDRVPDTKWRFSSGNKLVAQLSQNMNFVMDLTVEEFVTLHAQSRMIENIDEAVSSIIDEANHLAGEPFLAETPITSLSGGQSRALMIADTAILSQSPIVLIDEIENAGIDRKKALSLLVKKEKIVLMATHDPILALMADKRIIIRNGGIADVIEITQEERSLRSQLEKVDQFMMEKRRQLRAGEVLNVDDLSTLMLEGSQKE